MLAIVMAIVGLGLLVVLHEGGHFIAARLCGMRVERFSIGFGPKLFGFTKWGTIFQIAPIPLGGFVQITGLNPHEEFDRNDPFVYPNRPRWMRLFVVVAGPLANFITASLVMLFVFSAWPAPVPSRAERVDDVIADSAAAAAGVKAGDIIAEANGQAISVDYTISQQIKKTGGAPLTLKLLRDGKPVVVELTPRRQPSGNHLIGVALTHSELRDLGFAEAAKQALLYPYEQSKAYLGQLYMMVTGKMDAELSGPVEITRQIKSAAEKGGRYYLGIIAMLSVVLGMLNLLPLPALDGGRSVFLIIEGAIRRRINPRIEATVHGVGMVLLLGLLVIVSFKDITRIFGRG